MSSLITEKRSWLEVWKAWSHPRVITMLFLGFSAGIPILLIFSTLSAWLLEAGVRKSAVTFFSWAALGYSFKFVWAPLVDKIPLPILTGLLGRRRAWMLISQLAIILAIVSMACIDPATGKNSLTYMALAAVMLGFSSATQDIVIDAFRIECVEESYQALLSSMYIAGYRIGMVVAGAGSYYLADLLGTTKEMYRYESWQTTYLAVAATMLVGVLTTLIITEPERNRDPSVYRYSGMKYSQLFVVFLVSCAAFCALFFFSAGIVGQLKSQLSSIFFGDTLIVGFLVETLRLAMALCAGALVAFLFVLSGFLNKDLVVEAYIDPIKEFFVRYGGKTALLFLLLIGFYRISDIVLGIISNVFYLDMGFSKSVIAGITKAYGLGMTILGSFVGGVLTLRYGVYAILFLGAILSAATNLLFMVLAGNGADITLLTMVIAVDNLSAGIAAAAFVAFLSSLTNISFTAMQYAVFSSLMTLFPKLFGGYSGTMVSNFGYNNFFLMTTVIGVPVLFLIWFVKRSVDCENRQL